MLEGSEPVAGHDDATAMRLNCYVGDRIRQARVRQGMSLAELADLIGTQQSAVSDYEAGLERISAKVLYRIAVTLRVTLASLFGASPL